MNDQNSSKRRPDKPRVEPAGAPKAPSDSEERFRTFAEQTVDTVFIVDIQGAIVYVSPAAEDMFGFSAREAEGEHFLQFLAPESTDKAMAAFADVVNRGRPIRNLELGLKRIDGSVFFGELSASPYRSNAMTGVAGIIRDVSERKQVEDELRRRNQFVETVLENAPIGFAVNTISDGAAVLVSSNFEKIYGVEPHSIGGAVDFFEKVYRDPVFREEIRRRVMDDLTSGDAARTRWEDIPITTKAGEQRIVTAVNIPLPEQDLMISTVQDVTDRRRAEEALRERDAQLRHSQKMEAIGQLAGGIAHDFNNLLTAIIGYADLLLESEQCGRGSAREDVEEIRRAANRAASLTRQILAFSRRQALQPEVVSLNEVLSEMQPLLRRTLGEDIELEVLLDSDLELTEVDVHQFEQVLMNLAVNARDAMPAGGHLLLATANAQLDENYCRTHAEAQPGSFVLLSVSDTGIGMDEETQSRIFEPFFTTKAPGQGTGLGLSTAFGIIRQSGGTMNVYSEPGQGTSFKVYLPRSAKTRPPVPQVPVTAPSVKGEETILVVEDEDSLRTLVARVLKELGYTVLAVPSADEALEVLRGTARPIDLLLTDVVLPGGVQGDDLARIIKNFWCEVPVLFMSGYARNTIVHGGRLDNEVDLLEKPFTSASLARRVREVLDRGRTSKR